MTPFPFSGSLKSEFIPSVCYNAFYQSVGRKRLYPLIGFLSALIPTDALLIFFLSLSRKLRDFCGFSKVPDAPLFTRFKQDFLPYIEMIFQRLVDFTEPICHAVDSLLLIPSVSNSMSLKTTLKPSILSLKNSRLTAGIN